MAKVIVPPKDNVYTAMAFVTALAFIIGVGLSASSLGKYKVKGDEPTLNTLKLPEAPKTRELPVDTADAALAVPDVGDAAAPAEEPKAEDAEKPAADETKADEAGAADEADTDKADAADEGAAKEDNAADEAPADDAGPEE